MNTLSINNLSALENFNYKMNYICFCFEILKNFNFSNLDNDIQINQFDFLMSCISDLDTFKSDFQTFINCVKNDDDFCF